MGFGKALGSFVGRLLAAAVLILACTAAAEAAPRPTVTVAVLKFGTVSWELDVIRRHRLDEAAGIELKILELAGNQATQVALQAGSADLIVGDWLWVSRQRASGQALSFVPYSTAVGALVAGPGSGITDAAGLKGRRIGVAGGPLDKSWLILRAYARDRAGLDLEREATPVFAAPPLLSQKLEAGELDAVLTYWPFAARLKARGLREVAGVDGLMRGLGLATAVPAVGYVFREEWAKANPAALAGFLAASGQAKQRMATDDAEWERLRPLMQAEDTATWTALRDAYRAGIPGRWGEAERSAAETLFTMLVKTGGSELVGGQTALAPGTFWPAVRY